MVAGALSATPVVAQQSGPPHGPAARVLEHRKDLQLTDDQVKKLEALEKSQASMASRNDSLMRASRAESEKARSDVMAVLTPPQREKVDSLRWHYHDQYGKGRGGKGHKGHKETHDSTPC
jgi:Spy/CpxP family protein refolding chaperone